MEWVEGLPDSPDRRPVRPQDMRAADVDRERVLDRLRQAHVEGRLDVEEFDERITATLAAKTYGQLAVITEDLPALPEPVAAAGAEVAEPEENEQAEFRQVVQAWAGISVFSMVLWGIAGIATGGLIYPWFLWVAGPWGLLLLLSWLRERLKR
jgi:hypothetical protein